MPPYILKSSARAKHLRITIKADGSVIVTKPTRTSMARVEHFIKEKSSWVIEKVEHLKSHPIVAPTKHTKREVMILKEQAQALAEEKVKYFNRFYNFSYNSIFIKNQKTRWGSCSKQGNLNFNYKIVLLPEQLVDYLVVHEICHLGEFNHSQNFWNLVGEVLPDYKNLRIQLKKIAL